MNPFYYLYTPERTEVCFHVFSAITIELCQITGIKLYLEVICYESVGVDE